MGVTGQSLPPKNDFEPARGQRNSAYTVNLTYKTYHDIYVHVCVCRGPKSVGGITWAKRAHAQSQYWAVKPDQ